MKDVRVIVMVERNAGPFGARPSVDIEIEVGEGTDEQIKAVADKARELGEALADTIQGGRT